MSDTIAFHQAAIAFHQAEIDKLTGTPASSSFDVNNWRTWWPAMQDQAANNRLPHDWLIWGKDTPLPEQAGNNVPPPPIYETAKPFWHQMERQVPFVYDDHGKRFNALTCLQRGNDDFERNVRRLWDGQEGEDYRAAPGNAEIWPRIRV